METLGVCSICSKPAMHTCGLCGQMVCDRHFNSQSGLCDRCQSKVRKREKKFGHDDQLKRL